MVSADWMAGTGSWVHVAAAYDAQSGIMKLYYDGKLADTAYDLSGETVGDGASSGLSVVKFSIQRRQDKPDARGGQAGNVVTLPMEPNAADGLSLQADPEFYPGHSTSVWKYYIMGGESDSWLYNFYGGIDEFRVSDKVVPQKMLLVNQ